MGKNINYGRDENGNMIVLSEVEVPDPVLPPNWLGLEQGLRYSSLFAKAWGLAKQDTAISSGLNLFMITLSNGKRGDASENALTFAFSELGVSWEPEEKTLLNQYLSENNFTIRIE